jgi:hypothetical protein
VAGEFQTAPDPAMFGRLLANLSDIWTHLRPDPERGSRFNVGAAVVNLTGQGNVQESTVVTELAAQFKDKWWGEALAQGRAQGQALGRAEALLTVLEERFGPLPADLAAAVRGTADPARLRGWVLLAVPAADLAAFRAVAGV